MSASLLLLFCFSIHSVASSFEYFHHPVKPCRIGDVVQNECNKCLCTSKTVFECTPMDCNKTKNVEETKEITDHICLPSHLYVQNLITCICTKDGRWPHKSCEETFLSLPPSSVVQHKCDPDSYVLIDCNICKCGSDGEFITNRCTKNTCEDSTARRYHKDTTDKKNSVYSNCEAKNWYSLAPCQFCYCVNENKLVCNTGNDQNKKLELGTYDMQICGRDMIKEALELVPESQGNFRGGTDTNTDVAPEPLVQEATTVKMSDENVHSKHNKKRVTKIAQNAPEVDQNDMYYTDTQDAVTTNKEAADTVSNNARNNTVSVEENSNSDEDNSNEFDDPDQQLTIPRRDEVKKHVSEPQDELIPRTKAEKMIDLPPLEFNIPGVLNKVFSMALRKSMVTVNNQSQCVPGTKTSDGCNACFCLRNGKQLCSTQRC